MTAVGEIHRENFVAGFNRGEIDGHVRLCAAVRLHVDMFGAKELAGPVARLYVDTATAPTLVVPRVVASGGAGLGVWAGAFGRGAYFSNIRYAAAPDSAAAERARPRAHYQDVCPPCRRRLVTLAQGARVGGFG